MNGARHRVVVSRQDIEREREEAEKQARLEALGEAFQIKPMFPPSIGAYLCHRCMCYAKREIRLPKAEWLFICECCDAWDVASLAYVEQLQGQDLRDAYQARRS